MLALKLSRNVLPNVTQRYFASKTSASTDYKIIVTDDDSTIVAWHPKQDFPYECTKPLPETKVEERDSVLKTQYSPQIFEIFNKKTPEQIRQELMNITYTTKHRWFALTPTKEQKRRKPRVYDREYL